MVEQTLSMKHRDELIVGLYVTGVIVGVLINFALFAVLYDMGGWLK